MYHKPYELNIYLSLGISNIGGKLDLGVLIQSWMENTISEVIMVGSYLLNVKYLILSVKFLFKYESGGSNSLWSVSGRYFK